MKTRHGFVSNSSSSSFIVIRKDFLQNGHKSLITKKEEALLNKFGFKKVWCFHSNQVDTESDGLPESICKGRENEYNYGYFVSCNQTDVIYFLKTKFRLKHLFIIIILILSIIVVRKIL